MLYMNLDIYNSLKFTNPFFLSFNEILCTMNINISYKNQPLLFALGG